MIEALAALLVLGIVIPVAVRGIQIANLAGEVAERKAVAARIADRMLNEWVVTGQWQRVSSGVADEGGQTFQCQLRTQPWEKDSLKLLTIQVNYQVQGRPYDVRLSTVVDTTQL